VQVGHHEEQAFFLDSLEASHLLASAFGAICPYVEGKVLTLRAQNLNSCKVEAALIERLWAGFRALDGLFEC
jgi:hypothetical protein